MASLRFFCPNYPNIFHSLDLERTCIKERGRLKLISIFRAFLIKISHISYWITFHAFFMVSPQPGTFQSEPSPMEVSLEIVPIDAEVSWLFQF